MSDIGVNGNINKLPMPGKSKLQDDSYKLWSVRYNNFMQIYGKQLESDVDYKEEQLRLLQNMQRTAIKEENQTAISELEEKISSVSATIEKLKAKQSQQTQQVSAAQVLAIHNKQGTTATTPSKLPFPSGSELGPKEEWFDGFGEDSDKIEVVPSSKQDMKNPVETNTRQANSLVQIEPEQNAACENKEQKEWFSGWGEDSESAEVVPSENQEQVNEPAQDINETQPHDILTDDDLNNPKYKFKGYSKSPADSETSEPKNQGPVNEPAQDINETQSHDILTDDDLNNPKYKFKGYSNTPSDTEISEPKNKDEALSHVEQVPDSPVNNQPLVDDNTDVSESPENNKNNVPASDIQYEKVSETVVQPVTSEQKNEKPGVDTSSKVSDAGDKKIEKSEEKQVKNKKAKRNKKPVEETLSYKISMRLIKGWH